MSQLTTESIIHLTADNVSLIIDISQEQVSVLYWGKALRYPNTNSTNLELLTDSFNYSDLDVPVQPGFWRENSKGWLGVNSLLGHHLGANFSPNFKLISHSKIANKAEFSVLDAQINISAKVEFDLQANGILLITQSITNLSAEPFALNSLSTWLPLPSRATNLMSFTGRWVKERQMQLAPIAVGTFSREIRDGRSGHDATITMLAITPNCGFQVGEAWSCGLAWSGNSRHAVEKLPTGQQSIGAEELLLPGEIFLQPNQTYQAPQVVFAYSDTGLDGISNSHYKWLRSRPAHPTRFKPRPITLNVWEAVYFDHDLDKLTQLAKTAHELGVERFVLDDGWFNKRRNDYAGLGDWWVDKTVWPSGLTDLIKIVKSLEMEFGLWFEPEMVNPDSDLYRNHPDWILQVGGRVPPEQRHQLVLNLANPDVYEYLFEKINLLLTEYQIDYIKWDHNRVLIEPGYHEKAVVNEQTKAFYKLILQLKQAHPGLEIESCASGGARIDLGAAMYFDRFWTSDCNEALERNYIQRWTGIAIPPEMLGTHIGPPKSHTTGRTHNLSFRAVTAFFGHAGIEWDISQASPTEQQFLAQWISYHKLNRELLHSGNVVRVEQPDDAIWVHGVISEDQSNAIFSVSHLAAIKSSKAPNIRLAGLNPAAEYAVRMVEPAGPAETIQSSSPAWRFGVTLSGDILNNHGLRAEKLQPENAYLIEIKQVG